MNDLLLVFIQKKRVEIFQQQILILARQKTITK
jgi:hypothetical protein